MASGYRDRSGLSALDWNLLDAVERNGAAVRQAIQEGASVNCVQKHFSLSNPTNIFSIDTPLTKACKLGNDEIVRILLDKGADARWQDSHGWSALSRACQNGHLSIVEMMLNHDNSLLEIRSNRLETPLLVAICRSQVDVFHFLLNRGANVHAISSIGMTTLMAATGNLEIMRRVLDADVDVDVAARDHSQATVLHYAASRSCIAVRELIQEHNADMFVVDKYGYTPFDVAAGDRSPEGIADFLLQLYGNKVIQDHGHLALHAILRAAVYSFFEDTWTFHPPLNPLRIMLPLGALAPKHFRILLQHVGTHVVIANRDDSDQLPIHIACAANAPVEVLSMLLVAMNNDPATLRIADHTGSLPIHLLLCSSSTTMPTEYASVRHLVEQGGHGTLATRNHNGSLPLHNLVASTNPPLRCVQYLIQRFSESVAAQTNSGQYPFMLAACETSSASLSVVYELVRANPALVLPR